jgi:hypothetical protein
MNAGNRGGIEEYDFSDDVKNNEFEDKQNTHRRKYDPQEVS